MKTLPTSQQNEALLQALQRNGVRFLVVGGLAVRFYDETRETHDVDILVEPSAESARRLVDVLAGFGIRPDPNATASLQPYGTQVPVKCSGFEADILWEPSDRFAAQYAVGGDALVGSVPVRVASRDLLLERLARSREPKHVADTLSLRRLAKAPWSTSSRTASRATFSTPSAADASGPL